MGSVGDLRLVTEAEECLDAAHAHPPSHHLGNFIQAVGTGLGGFRQLREGAVGAAIPAKIRQGNEDVSRNADGVALGAALALESALENWFADRLVGQPRTQTRGRTALEATVLNRLGDEALRLPAGERGRVLGGRETQREPFCVEDRPGRTLRLYHGRGECFTGQLTSSRVRVIRTPA